MKEIRNKLTKLNIEEKLLISKKISRLKELNQIAISKNCNAYDYDWHQLDRTLNEAINEYQHILNTNDCVK